MYIAVDFDGTCCSNNFPDIGEDIGAIDALKYLIKEGHKIILYTMRSHPVDGQSDESLKEKGLKPIGKEKDTLQEAIDWFKKNDIELYAVNENPSQKEWTKSPKVFANYYIDDRAIGTPLLQCGDKVYVDWYQIMTFFYNINAISQETYDNYLNDERKNGIFNNY